MRPSLSSQEDFGKFLKFPRYGAGRLGGFWRYAICRFVRLCWSACLLHVHLLAQGRDITREVFHNEEEDDYKLCPANKCDCSSGQPQQLTLA